MTPTAASAAPTFEDLLREVLPRATRFARRLTRNPSDADDLVQEAGLLALRGFGSFQPGTNFPAWFLRIQLNAFYSRARRWKVSGPGGAAQALGLKPTTLEARMKRLGIVRP